MRQKRDTPAATEAGRPAPNENATVRELTKSAKQTFDKLDKLAQRLENTGIARYVELSQKTGKILWLNFLSGVARGLGFTIGTTIVIAIAYQIVSNIISMNIPFITEWLIDFVDLIQRGVTSTMGQSPQYLYHGADIVSPDLVPIAQPPVPPIPGIGAP